MYVHICMRSIVHKISTSCTWMHMKYVVHGLIDYVCMNVCMYVCIFQQQLRLRTLFPDLSDSTAKLSHRITATAVQVRSFPVLIYVCMGLLCMYVHVCMCSRLSTLCIFEFICTVCMYVCIYVSYVSLCLYACMHACMYVCIC